MSKAFVNEDAAAEIDLEDEVDDGPEEFETGCAFPARVGVREVLTNISSRGSAQDCVGDRMTHGVRV